MINLTCFLSPFIFSTSTLSTNILIKLGSSFCKSTFEVRVFLTSIIFSFNFVSSALGLLSLSIFFFKELIPHIEKTYRVRAESRYRAISGLSMGGGGALFYALHYPEMFVAAAPLSAVGGEWTFDQMKNQSDLSKVSEEKKAEILGQMDIQTILEKSPKEKLDRIKWIRWYISCGDDDFLSITNCLLHNTLLQHQVGHEFRVKDGGHSWTYWRMELPEVMRFVSRIFTQY